MPDIQKPSSSAPYILALLKDGKIEPKKINAHQRRVCVRFLLQKKKYTQVEIAEILHVPPVYVYRDKIKIQEQNSWMLDELDERKIAFDIIQTAEFASAALFRNGKPKEAFDVEAKAVDILQTLGYLKRTAIEFKGQIELQEILKLGNTPDTEDETLLSERAGQGRKNFITNGAS